MIVSDLGRRDGPVLIFGGPYSNVQATQALLTEASARGISGDHMLCTGDIVAYCGSPAATVAAVRAAGCAVVAGNCERQLAAGGPDCGCGFEDGSACDLLSVGWYGFASAQVPAQDVAWMGTLPDIITFRHQGARYAALHGGATDIARFIWPDSDDAVFAEEWVAVEAACGEVDHIIAGHSGVPFIRKLPQGRWINAGVIGMPPHDGRQQTRFAVLDGGDVQIMRLDYDVASAGGDMRNAGLTQGYDSALLRGYWPSEDVLPETLRVPSLVPTLASG